MADRYTRLQIADALGIELTTANTHIFHIYKKLGNRGKVLEWWEQHRHEYGQ
jgi:DNA-binding CsgD family transcriptional regulator